MSDVTGLHVGFAAAQDTMARQEQLIETLRVAIPDDPWVRDGVVEYHCYSCRARVLSGQHPDAEGASFVDHEPDCRWLLATTALRARDER